MRVSQAPERVTVNLLSRPYGVDPRRLTFAFRMGGKGQDRVQTGYRMVFARTAGDLARGDYLLDTGMVKSSASCGIAVAGLSERLSPHTCYYMQVQTEDQSGAVSPFCEPVAFFTGGAWQSAGCWAAGQPDFCLLRRVFTLDRLPAKAFVQVTASSPEPIRQYVYQLQCNGQSVCIGPTRTDRDGEQTILYYETVDVTDLLRVGGNCLSAAAYTTKDHCFACRLITVDEQGAHTVLLETPDGWQAMDATPLFRPDGRSIGTNYFFASAENVDGSVWPRGWDQPSYAGKDFAPAAATEPPGGDDTLRAAPIPPVRWFCVPAALSQEREEGVLFVDLGREIVGALRLTFTCEQPLDLTLRYGEELDEQGHVRCPMRTGNRYEEHWRLAAGENDLRGFGMKTFRYVEIAGMPCGVGEEAVCGVAYRTDFDETASYFTGSSELLNAVYDLCKYTVQATNQNLYVDSQSRERCAYEGDVLINMLTAAAVSDDYALSRFSLAYLLTHRTWPAEYVLFGSVMARLDCLYTGDRALLARAYPMLCNMHYLSYRDERVGLLKNPTMAGNVTDAVLVDWPASERDGYAYDRAAYNTVFNAVQVKALKDLSWIAAQVDHPADSARFAAMAADLQAAMIEKLYDPATGAFRDGLTESGEPLDHFAQHATAFALYAGVFDTPAMAEKMAAWLADQGAIRMSVYGAFFLLEGLYHAGRGDAANALLLCDDVSDGARTWAYMLDKLDATITTEAWNPKNKGNMTWSHPWGSAAGAAIVRGLFGIRPLTPGFAEFSVDLQPEGLRYAAVQAPTVKGAVIASFDRTRPQAPLCLTLTVPANAAAHVRVPAAAGLAVYENDQPVSAAYENGRYVWKAGSGEHAYEIR